MTLHYMVDTGDIKLWVASRDPDGTHVTTKMIVVLVDNYMDNGCGDACAVMVTSQHYDPVGVQYLNCEIERNTYYTLHRDLIRHILDAYDPDYRYISAPAH